MCGILGVVGQVSRFEPRFQGALDSIAHRGPDGEGVYASDDILFGHRRLAIIDLGPGGHQPMVDAATGTVLTYNGEIYNYREIRAELEALGVAFETRSDTEVLLRAFLQWGNDMFPRLNGMWAFAIWEPRHQRLTLSRDRFGVKPLYWHATGGTLLFASEAKALIALDPRLAVANPRAVYDLIVHSRSHAGDSSYYRDIAVLPPASVATFNIGDPAPAIARFWDYPEPIGDAGDDATEAFAAIFDDAVALRMRSDVPVGLTLSGGLDSSAVLAAAQARSSTPIHCFTSVYDTTQRGEEKWARIAADACAAALESVPAGAGDWLGTLQAIVHHMDGPGFSPAVFPLWAIMARARATGVIVLLEGQGADELLAGYPQHGAAELAARAAGVLRGRTSPLNVRNTYRGLAATFGAKMLLLWTARQQAPTLFDRAGPRRAREQLFLRVAAAAGESAGVAPPPGYGALARALHRDHADAVLPALLHYGDAISMAHGIEGRLPFMDYRLVEWVFRARPRLIDGAGRTKAPVRRYLAKHGMKVIADRADKQGYPTMVAQWLNTGAGKVYIDDLMASPGAAIWSMLDRAAVRPLVARARGGDATPVYHLYKIVATQIWLEQLARPPAAATAPVIARQAAG